jgi:hypothetical protein
MPDGEEFIRPDLIAEMQRPQAKEPGQQGDYPARGLAWVIEEVGGRRALRHGGSTDANNAQLFVIPEDRFAFALLTNAGSGSALVTPTLADVARDVLGIDVGDVLDEEIPPLPEEPPALNKEAYAGEWEQQNGKVSVEHTSDGLRWSFRTKGDMEGLAHDIVDIPLEPVTQELFLALIPTGGDPIALPIRFFDFDESGRPTYIHLSGRLARRTA